MRLALIRQRYTPYGGAERFLEAALEALLERNVAITLYARDWPETRLQLIELAMQAEQERLVLEAKVGELAPKAEALDRISTADVGSLCITNAAKALQATCADSEGRKLCDLFGIEAFVPANNAAIEPAITLWKQGK